MTQQWHKNCCENCKKLQRLPLDETIQSHYSILKDHLVCLKSSSERKKCARKKDLIAAAQWIIATLSEDKDDTL